MTQIRHPSDLLAEDPRWLAGVTDDHQVRLGVSAAREDSDEEPMRIIGNGDLGVTRAEAGPLARPMI